MTYDEKAKFLNANGWRSHWSESNWVKSSEKVNDMCGYHIDVAYEIAVKEAKAIEAYNAHIKELNEFSQTKWHWPEFKDLNAYGKAQVIEQFSS